MFFVTLVTSLIGSHTAWPHMVMACTCPSYCVRSWSFPAELMMLRQLRWKICNVLFSFPDWNENEHFCFSFYDNENKNRSFKKIRYTLVVISTVVIMANRNGGKIKKRYFVFQYTCFNIGREISCSRSSSYHTGSDQDRRTKIHSSFDIYMPIMWPKQSTSFSLEPSGPGFM